MLYNLVFAGQKFVAFYQEKFCCFNLHPQETKIKVEKHLTALVNGFPLEGVNSKIEETRKTFEQEFIEEASQISKKPPSSNAEKYFEEIMMKMRQIEDIKRFGIFKELKKFFFFS